MQRPPLLILIIYAIGQLGWSLASFAAGNLLVYFYMPPETGETLFPTFIYQGSLLGILTLIGLLSAGGRLLDAFIDPLIANWSDSKIAAIGKRRWFLLVSALPFALFSWLIFVPISPEAGLSNGLWLGICIGLYYFFLAMYVIPYTALIAELGHAPKDRLLISSLIGVTFAVGYLLGSQIVPVQRLFLSSTGSSTLAFQYALGLFSVLALLCMLVPALFLPEKRYARQLTQVHTLRDSLRTVFANYNYRYFLVSNFLYWLSLTFIQLGIFFYVPILFGLDSGMAGAFLAISFITSFILYIPINKATLRWGKKRLLLVGFGIFALLFGIVACLPFLPVPKLPALYLLGVAAAFPLAVFGILPNVVVGDVVEAQERATGQQLSGMFYGVGAFVMKLGVSFANLLFPSLLLLGKSTENPLGVQATALAALGFCVAGWWVFRKFQE